MGHEHKYMGHETVNWGVRGLGYMLFNVYLCNQPYYREVVVGPGTHLCTLLEVGVLGVGMSTLDTTTFLYSEDRGLQVPLSLEHVNIVGTQCCDKTSRVS